jgi:hypothetical protein
MSSPVRTGPLVLARISVQLYGLQKLHVPLVDRARNYDIIYAEGRMLGGLKEGGEGPKMAQFHEQVNEILT